MGGDFENAPTTMMMMDNDSSNNGHDMTKMLNEELPPFREAQPAARSRTPPPPPSSMMAMMKPITALHSDALSRGDSSSSTAGSTIEVAEVASAKQQQQQQHEDVQVHVTEPARDGDWLQQLQYRLYSREEEEAILLRTYLNSRRPSAFRKSSTIGELCLISGAGGLGKTRLARTLEAPVKEDGGYFLLAKFDQVKQAKPTRIFADAFADYADAVLAQGLEAVEAIRQTILETVGDELSVLLCAIPALERILGRTNVEAVQMNCAMAKRFVFALQDLMAAVCTAETPMVLLVDDLQYADPCSLKLLKGFIIGNQNRHLFILATCDDSVSPSSPVSGMLRELEDDNNRPIYNIEVSAKPCKVIWKIITDTLPMTQDRHDALAELVCSQTQGNPLYVLEFMRWLWDEKLLQYDAAEGSWILHGNDVRLAVKSCLGQFLVRKLEQLPEDVQDVIKVAACFGSEINEHLMEVVFVSDALHDKLHEATSRGVLVFDQDLGYSFRHDGVQNAALALIPSEDKEAMHLRLGRKLLKRLTAQEREKHMFLILGQLRVGKRLINDPREREAVAMLCLNAGQASARASAFGAAAGYLELGIELLGASWEGDYSLKLALHNAAAEMHLTVSNYERAHELLDAIFDNAPKLNDRIQAYNTLIYAYGMTDRQHMAVDTGVKVLAELGETFPRRNCMAKLRGEMRKVKGLLRGKSNAQILRMEMIHDEKKVAALQLLNIMFLNVTLVRPKFAPFIQLKSVEITMKHGLSALSSIAFASYGMLCAAIGKYDESFRYGQLALDLLKKFGTKEYAPRVFAAVYGCIIPWQRPIRETIEPLKRAQQIGSQTGDIEFACLNANLYSTAVFFSNSTLPDVSRQIGDLITMMSSRRQDSMLVLIKPMYQLTHNLMGLADDPSTLSGSIVEVNDASRHAEETKNVTSLLCIRLQKLMLYFLFSDYAAARSVVAELEAETFPGPGIEQIFCSFLLA